jgi:hypothetical protein
MKLFKNITLILTLLSISIISIITCSSYTIIETERFGSYAVFEYPVPDGMIT